jgi:hypothetical protein
MGLTSIRPARKKKHSLNTPAHPTRHVTTGERRILRWPPPPRPTPTAPAIPPQRNIRGGCPRRRSRCPRYPQQGEGPLSPIAAPGTDVLLPDPGAWGRVRPLRRGGRPAAASGADPRAGGSVQGRAPALRGEEEGEGCAVR